MCISAGTASANTQFNTSSDFFNEPETTSRDLFNEPETTSHDLFNERKTISRDFIIRSESTNASNEFIMPPACTTITSDVPS